MPAHALRPAPLAAPILAVLALTAVAPRAALAAEAATDAAPAPNASGSATELDRVVVQGRAETLYRVPSSSVGTRTDTPLERVPQSIQVLPRQLIEDQAARQVTELYRSISGVSFFSYAGVTFRGFRQENVLYDGLRGDPYSGFSVPQLFNIERVEVLKGPAGAVYGSGEPGGLINYVTKKPQATPSRRLELQAGNYDYRAGSFEATGPIVGSERFRYRAGVYAEREQPFRNNTDVDARIADVGLAMDVGDRGGELVVQYTDIDQRLGANRLRGVPVNNDGVFLTDIGWTTNEPTDFLHNQAQVALAKLTLPLTDALDLDAAVRRFENHERQQYHEPRGLLPDGRTMLREFRDQFRDNQGDAANLNLVARFDAGGLSHTLLAGAEYSDIENRSLSRTARPFDPRTGRGVVPPLDLFDPVYGRSGARDYGLEALPLTGFDSVARRTGVYLQDEVALGARWRLLAGLRRDRFDDRVAFAGDSARYASSDTTWRLGATYIVRDGLNLYASSATGFVPQAADAQTPLTGGPFEPQRSRQWELGMKSTFGDGRFGLNAAVYRIERSNLLQSTGADPGNDGFDDFEALGLVRSEGAELDLLADLTERWVLALNLAYNDARVVEGSPSAAGNTAGPGSDRFANAPRRQAGLWTRYELPALASAVGFGFDHVGDRISLDGQAVKAYTVFDASWQTRLGAWTLQANVKNLFDKVYAASGFNARGGHFPGEPRRLYLQASYEF